MVTMTSLNFSIISENLYLLGFITITTMPLLPKPFALTHNPPSPHLVLHLTALRPPARGPLSASQSIPMKRSTRIQPLSISSLVLFGLAELLSNGTKTFPQ
jgi:hypothetical protein